MTAQKQLLIQQATEASLLLKVMRRLGPDTPTLIAWPERATAKDYASLPPIVLGYAEAGDPFAKEIVAEGARHVGVLIRSLVDFGAPRVSLLGGVASRLVRWLAPDVLHFLSPPEDDAVAGALTEHISPRLVDLDSWSTDVVIAVAASGTTPFTMGALRAAGARGAVSIALANNRGAPLFELARHRILIETGTEVLAGSTRMQAGTAQKIVLNLFSTAVMVKPGRVYRGLIVSMRASNTKLLHRAEVIVSQIVGCAENDAAKFVQRAEGHVKVAVLLGLGLEQAKAIEALRKHEGNLRSAIDELTHDPT